MQYPTLPIESLRKMFKGDEDIIFVGNEDNFNNALSNASYEEYFVDSYGGTWGHTTIKGNQLIAENVADTILKEIQVN